MKCCYILYKDNKVHACYLDREKAVATMEAEIEKDEWSAHTWSITMAELKE